MRELKTKSRDNELAELQQTIMEQQAKLAELTDLAQRTRADFENYRKNSEANIANYCRSLTP